uniref:AlNc14C2G290 protein n=1 Tax=Albugo laibachii Nc14 TaxID=890382 RepID=F0VZF2_9STRA|nr:AlNc14C2G290 [Albugo laibachii Nc14]|eukprot:CCA14182.1 AlNc14C2G290 [Albugo laibachii Nc14]
MLLWILVVIKSSASKKLLIFAWRFADISSCTTISNCATAITIFRCQLQLTQDDKIGSLYIDVRSRYRHFGMSDKEVSDGDEYDEDWDEGPQTHINNDAEIVHPIELRFVDLNLEKDESERLDGQIAQCTLELHQQVSSAQNSPYKYSVQNDSVGHNNGKYYSESVVLIHGKRYDVRHSIFDGPNIASRRVTLYHEKWRVQEANLQRERDQARKKLHEIRHSINGCYEDIGVAGIPAKQRLWMYYVRKRKSEKGKQEQTSRERRNRWYHQRTRPSQYNAKKEAAKYVMHKKHETQERILKEEAVVTRIECNQRKLRLKSKRLLEYSTSGYVKGCHILETLPSQ